MLLAREIASRLDAKCDKLANAVIIDDIGKSEIFHHSTCNLSNISIHIACLDCLISAWIKPAQINS